MKLSELCQGGRDLRGGMLVEYTRGYGFSNEFGRAMITRVGFSPKQPDYFEIETNGDVNMGLCLSYHADHEITLADGVYMWESPMGWAYAVAPPGVEIPSPPALELRYALHRT